MNYYVITETNWAKLRDEILNLAECCHKAFGEKSKHTDWLHNGDVCQLLNISRITLNASVQAQYGQTAVHLLKQRLLAEIKNEILFTDKTTSELAYEFNFSEPGHLMRFFKKQTGQTVTEFKEEYKGQQFTAE